MICQPIGTREPPPSQESFRVSGELRFCDVPAASGSQFPTSALWVIGMLFGIEMMFSGWAFVMIAMAARPGKEGE
jgi:hypothetical protein